jgi:hypothetical protein
MKRTSKFVLVSMPRTFKVRLPTFKPSPQLKYLDTAKLARGNHKIEVGKFDGCACDCAVTATVTNGKVTGVSYTKCKSARPVSTKASKILRDAHRALLKGVRTKWTDFPVGDLSSSTVVARMTDIIVSDGCFMVCWDEGRGEECVICCFEKNSHWCIGPSEPALALF